MANRAEVWPHLPLALPLNPQLMTHSGGVCGGQAAPLWPWAAFLDPAELGELIARIPHSALAGHSRQPCQGSDGSAHCGPSPTRITESLTSLATGFWQITVQEAISSYAPSRKECGRLAFCGPPGRNTRQGRNQHWALASRVTCSRGPVAFWSELEQTVQVCFLHGDAPGALTFLSS